MNYKKKKNNIPQMQPFGFYRITSYPIPIFGLEAV